MARKKKSDAVHFKNVFPEDYKFLELMLTVNKDNMVNEYNIKLNDEYKKNSFEVHPEWDLPYKMRSMLLLKRDKHTDFSSLCHSGKNKEAKGITYGHKGDTIWKDYLFEMPNIKQILGINRDMSVHNLKNIFKSPFLFLLHLYLEVGMESLWNYAYSEFGETIAAIIELAIRKYENNEEKVEFTCLQMRYIFVIFFGLDAAKSLYCDEELYFDYMNSMEECKEDSIDVRTAKCIADILANNIEIEDLGRFREAIRGHKCIGGYITDEQSDTIDRYRKIETKMDEIMESVISKHLRFKDDGFKKITQEKGETIYIPLYLRSIFIGIHKYPDELPFKVFLKLYDQESENVDKGANNEKNKKQTLWSKLSVRPIYNIDEDIWKSYCKIYVHSSYKRKIESCYGEINKLFDQNKIDTYLNDLYIFYIGTLSIVFSEEESKYKEASLDAFERMFSLYLFKLETDLLYERFEAVGDLLEQGKESDEEKEEEEKERLEKAKYIVKTFSPDVLYDLYCSPGIYHRIYLSEYILGIRNDPKTQEDIYHEYQERDELESSEADLLIRIIAEINKEYFRVEKSCIREFFLDCDQKKLNLSDLHQICQENNKGNGYREYYDEIEKALKKEIINDKRKKGIEVKENDKKLIQDNCDRLIVKRVVKRILNKKEFTPAYKLIHLWVIFSSYFPREFSWVTLKNE